MNRCRQNPFAVAVALAFLWLALIGVARADAQPIPKATIELKLNTDTLQPGQQAIAAVIVTVRDGYHAQSHEPIQKGLIPFTATLDVGPNTKAADALYPPGKIENFEAMGGDVSVLSGRILTFVPIVVADDAPPGPITLTANVRLQICNDRVCDPPARLSVKLDTTIVARGSPQHATDSDTFKAFDPIVYQNQHATPATASTTQAGAGEMRISAAAEVEVARWLPYSSDALAKARASGKPVIVDFTAAWCINCHVVERNVYGDAATLSELGKRGVTLIKCDLTDDGAPGSDLLQKYNPARSIPFTAVYFPGKEEPAGMLGIYSSADLFKTLDDAGATPTSATRVFGVELKNAPLPLVLLIAIGVGVLLNAVPCVLPVLPLKAMSFYEDAGHDRGRSMLNGGVFSLGVIVAFGALALFVITQDALWGKFISHPITAAILGLVLLGAALQAFGLFEIVLPRSVTNLEGKASGASLAGNFFSGLLIAVLSTPCTIGLFAAVIAVAIASGAVLGSLTLMFVGVGMALPWFILSAFPALTMKFPRTGPWPSIVKQMMGFLLIATAIFFVQPLMPASLRGNVMWWMIFACIVASAIFLMTRTLQVAPRPRPLAIASLVSLVWVAAGLMLTLALST